MKVTQVAEILNVAIRETLGKQALGEDGEPIAEYIVQEDLSNVVSVGQTFSDILEENNAYDKYIGKLINHIGRVKFVNRVYKGEAPSVLMEDWEFGSILEKVDMGLPDSEWNTSWELTNGASYDQDVFKGPQDVEAQFFNDMVTFEVDMSITNKQVKQSFSSADQLNGFFSMIENRIQMRRTIDYDNLIMRTINHFIGATFISSFDDLSDLSGSTGARAINLLHLYKTQVPSADQTLTPETCLKSLEFLKFASYIIMLTSDRLVKASTIFNISGRVRFTPKEFQHIILLSEFQRGADVYLQSDTFHNELTRLPKADTVTYWQGSGEDFSFANTSEIHVQLFKPNMAQTVGNKEEVAISGIIGVIFDHEALGVNNKDNRVTTHYNAKAEFTNNFYKSDARFFNDYKENFVVFFVE